ncbi:MAG: hypothetical protein OEW24_06470 [Chloroflexota bacterium]|nr:hypothetical protein [Chloroflexota bacterium]
MAKKTLSRREAEARAEARRRSRMLARGETIDDSAGEDEPMPASGRQSLTFLQRIFPPAPPLPGKTDPLLGFTYSGPLPQVVSSFWLIRRNLYAGVGMGILWAAAYIVTVLYAQSVIGVSASFLSFGSLVAAGWLGWQRPWLYGLVAAVVGYVLFASYFSYLAANDPGAPVAAGELAQYLFSNGLLQVGIGALAGFYGGYLRRRFSDPNLRREQARRKR